MICLSGKLIRHPATFGLQVLPQVEVTSTEFDILEQIRSLGALDTLKLQAC
jgi:hypothetical protein